MSEPTPEKRAEWKARAAQKEAIVPHYFEVSVSRVEITCGECRHEFRRTLLMNFDEPTFICPQCRAKNWVPVTFDLT